MHVVVIGCGRVGSSVAQRLEQQGWTVSVVDEAAESFNRLDAAFRGGTFQGHAFDQATLRAAGIEQADACVVSTNGDNTNILTAQLVQKKFGVARVVVRILDPSRAEFYASQGLSTICPTKAAIDELSSAILAPTGAA